MRNSTLPLPSFYDPNTVVDLRAVNYERLFADANSWRKQHNLTASSTDGRKIGLLIIDGQNTFLRPNPFGGELFVAGRTGQGAIDDTIRLVEFIYKHLGLITDIHCTLDTHRAYAIFHATMLVDEFGNHPAPFTIVTYEDVKHGKWSVNPLVAGALGTSLASLQRHLEHYCKTLKEIGRYELTIWPFHGMIGGTGHALASGIEEAVNFHSFARGSQPGIEVKGTNPYTENYSVLGPEVLLGADGRPIGQRNTKFVEKLLTYDQLIIAGQAKSHCVAWTIEDLLNDISKRDPSLASKVCILEDCTTAIAVPDGKGGFAVDYTDAADQAFKRFADAGMKLIKSTDPADSWAFAK